MSSRRWLAALSLVMALAGCAPGVVGPGQTPNALMRLYMSFRQTETPTVACDDRRRPGQFHYGVVDVHLPDVVRAVRLRAGCCVLLVDVADGIAVVPILHR